MDWWRRHCGRLLLWPEQVTQRLMACELRTGRQEIVLHAGGVGHEGGMHQASAMMVCSGAPLRDGTPAGRP